MDTLFWMCAALTVALIGVTAAKECFKRGQR